MMAVLAAKFDKGTPWEEALLKTGDAFLLEHNSVTNRDKVWSDNHDGEGTNWLGLELMLLRDHLSEKDQWSSFIRELIVPATGMPRDQDCANQWQDMIRMATSSVLRELKKLPSTPRTGPDAQALFQDSAAAGEAAACIR